jgi:MoaA/NifB/PqqE/SkfB family radical SAM enzyme
MILRDCWLEVTTRCNSRCITCNIWKRDGADELSLEEIKSILKSRCLKALRHFYITGGEPFLRDDLAEIVNFISSKIGCAISLTTNGLLPERIYSVVKKMNPRPCMDISLNGRKDMHDFTRGVKDAFDKAIRTREYLLNIGINAPFLFTICPYNIKEISWVQRFSKELGTSVNFALAKPIERIISQDLDIYTYSTEQKEEILSQLPLSNFKYALERFFKNKLWFACQYGLKSVDISSTGSVYPCSHFVPEMKIGNVREVNFDEIMNSKRRRKTVKMIQNYECQPCSISISHAVNSITWGGGYLTKRKINKLTRFLFSINCRIKRSAGFPKKILRYIKRG